MSYDPEKRKAVVRAKNARYRAAHPEYWRALREVQPNLPEWYSWRSMRTRCTNSNRKDWMNYGGRGIGYDPAWESFEQFLADMGPRPAGTTLDRIDVDGDYSASNCRWADWITQANNKRPRRVAS